MVALSADREDRRLCIVLCVLRVASCLRRVSRVNDRAARSLADQQRARPFTSTTLLSSIQNSKFTPTDLNLHAAMTTIRRS